MRHGTKYSYDHGCRCDACRDAKMAHRREQRARGRAENRPAYHRELAHARALKESYRGVCKKCGATTNGSDGPGTAAELCVPCANAAIGVRRRGTGPTEQKVLALLAKRPARMCEVAKQVGITNQHAGNVLHRLRVYGHVERISRGVYRATEQAAA